MDMELTPIEKIIKKTILRMIEIIKKLIINFLTTKWSAWGLGKKILILMPIIYLFLSSNIMATLLAWARDMWFLLCIIAIQLWWHTRLAENAKYRNDQLNPPARKYQTSCQIVFSKMRSALNEKSYGFGDKWHFITADVQTNKIIADLKLSDDSGGEQRKKAYLRMAAQLYPADEGETTILKLAFYENSEFRQEENFQAIHDLIASIDTSIGKPQLEDKSQPPKCFTEPDFRPHIFAIAVALIFARTIYDGVHSVNQAFNHALGGPNHDLQLESNDTILK